MQELEEFEMITVYFNYPMKKIKVHCNPSCSSIQKNQKKSQRRISISLQNLSVELQKFGQGKYSFASKAENNDMWVEVNCQDEQFERAILSYIHRLLGKRYKPFADIKLTEHDCSK